MARELVCPDGFIKKAGYCIRDPKKKSEDEMYREYGIPLIRAAERDKNLYAYIEKRTYYPGEEGEFESPKDYDMAVTLAELQAIREIIGEMI